MTLATRPLTDEESSALYQGLSFAARIAKGERPLALAQVQRLYDRFVAEGVDDEEAIISLGLAFGETLMQSGLFEWLRVDDEYGSETSLGLIGKAVYCHPISMIQKRLANREYVDFVEFHDGLVARQLEMAKTCGDRTE